MSQKMADHFAGSPTVGSHDHIVTNEELHAKLNQLERRLIETQAQVAPKEEKPKKIKWKKVIKIFTAFIVPVLAFLPKMINAVAGFMKAKNMVTAQLAQ